ncbi:NEDD8 ultimate buster 1 [Nibea albiflora]|uniref:NEDD8 ultimate buster 1 n=1 Tax=Nibea albiflora TaxID=240163 RepID=A0ACB7F600_NIBAL|nr:NEDD8 ultimate buster 1 [Nibea albiflora]
MAELNTEAKLKKQLKQEKIQLWNPPYTDDHDNQPGRQHMQELALRYAPLLCLPVEEVGGALESIRVQAVKRGKGNKTFRESNVATLELLLPRDGKKALILAMGFHEKGRSLMKKKQFDNALCHLLQADQQFSSVDNYAVLQLDIVWCYRALEALSCLDDGKSRLQRAEDCFLQCYGEQQQRLLMIKSLLSYIEGNDAQARHQLSKVESLYSRLCLDSEKMAQLMTLGFTEREARLGLRACQGDLQEAAIHISNQRQILLDSSQASLVTNNNTDGVSPDKVEQLLYLGFERAVSEAALRLTGGDVQSATQLLLDNQGVLSPELLSMSPPSTSSSSPSSEEPSTSSNSAADDELVNEVLEDISRHEEDYLDLTLEEESELIATMKSYLNRGPTHTV